VSHQVGRARSIETLEATARVPPTAEAAARSVLGRLSSERDVDAAPHLAQRAFILGLDEARRLASTGCVLARTAKLEATDGDHARVRATRTVQRASRTTRSDTEPRTSRSLRFLLCDPMNTSVASVRRAIRGGLVGSHPDRGVDDAPDRGGLRSARDHVRDPRVDEALDAIGVVDGDVPGR
jgi:hypothetical protein